MDYHSIHQELVEGCKAGDRKAQFRLYQQYSKAMYNICLRMLNDPTEAEDLLQNSFMDVFSKLHYFRYESAIGAWIKRIVINNCINYLQKKRLKITDLDAYDVADEPPATEETEVAWTVERIQRAMAELPEGYRVVLSLYLMEGYDHQEIGEILNISPSTSKSQYSRAKAKLREIILAKKGKN